MSTRRSTSERIDAQKERMEQMQNEMKRLKRLQSAEERKARTHRICTRGGYIERILPDTIGLSDERFFTFLEKTVANEFGRRALAALKAEQDKEDARNAKLEAEDSNDTPAESSTVATARGEEATLKSAAQKQNGSGASTPNPSQTMAAPYRADGSKTGNGGATSR